MSTGKLFFAARCELLQFGKIGVLNFICDHSSGMSGINMAVLL